MFRDSHLTFAHPALFGQFGVLFRFIVVIFQPFWAFFFLAICLTMSGQIVDIFK